MELCCKSLGSLLLPVDCVVERQAVEAKPMANSTLLYSRQKPLLGRAEFCRADHLFGWFFPSSSDLWKQHDGLNNGTACHQPCL